MVDAAQGVLVDRGADSTNAQLQSRCRLLALEIRSQMCGFAVFELPMRLLDWGVRKYRGAQQRASLEKRLNGLLELHAPSELVTRARERLSQSAHASILSVVEVVRTLAIERSIKMESLNTQEIKTFFAAHGCNTKHQIASLLARWFEDLSWRVPPKRKVWQSEAPVMLIFDAAATAITFLNRKLGASNKSIPDSELR